MRSDRNATLNFSLVSIPVGVAPGVKRESVSFKTIHRKCSTPVNQKWHCKTCGVDVNGEETMRGIEVSKAGPWLPVEDSEYESAESDFSQGIMLTKFIQQDRLAELLYGKGHWLIPNDKDPGQRYWSLWLAMKDAGVVGLGRSNLYKTEQVIAVAPVPGGMVMFDLHAPWEVVPPDWKPEPGLENDVKLAGALIASLTDVPEDEDFERRDLTRKKALVLSKTKGTKVKAAKKVELPVPGDFQEQLKASIALAKKNKTKARAGSKR